MKLKFSLFLILCLFGQSVLADIVIDNTVRSGRMPSSKTKASSIVSSSAYKKDISAENSKMIIEELKTKIKRTPNDFSLYVPLIDTYLSVKEYQAAYNELLFLLSMKDQGALSEKILNQISDLKLRTIAANKYVKSKSSLYVNLAVMNLILNNNSQAEVYIKQSVVNAEDSGFVLDAIKFVFDYTGNFEEAVSVCNFYSSLFPGELEIRKLKINYLVQSGNINAALNEYKYILSTEEEVDDSVKYSVYKILTAKKTSEKEMLKMLFGEDSSNKELCYFNLYNMTLDNNDFEAARFYADKLQKEYPNSLRASFIDAELLIEEGNQAKAIEILNSIKDKLVTKEDIKEFDSLMVRASIRPLKDVMMLFRQGHIQKALDLLESGSIPTSLRAVLLKARCYTELRQMSKALENLNLAMSMDDSDAFLYFCFAKYFFVDGDYISARQYIEKALQIDPNLDVALYFLDELNKAEADKYVSQILSSFDAQNYTETMRVIDKALSIDPKSSDLYYYKGLTYIAQNNYASSTAALLKSIELDKNNALAYYYLAIAFDNLSENKNALAYYKQFIKMFPQDDYGEGEKIQYAQSRIQKLQVDK